MATTTTGTIEIIQQLEGLDQVPEEQIQWMLDQGKTYTIPKGDFLFKPGDPADHLHIVLEGKVRGYFESNGQQREFGIFSGPTITGILPYSRMKETGGSGVAIVDTKVFSIHKSYFPEMIHNHHELTQAFVHTMTSRVRSFTALQQQNEKLMSLGKLSAGLAHELNNPASAIVRSAQELKHHLKLIPDSFKSVIKIQMTDEEVDAVNELLFQKIGQQPEDELSLMEKTDLEDELAEWLEDHGMEDGYELAPNLVEYRFTTDDLEFINEKVKGTHFLPVIHWINNNLITEKMVLEIEEASTRIAELVASVKTYTHMDRAQVKQAVNIHEGLNSTLTMLKHKIHKGNITLDKDYEHDLPAVSGYPGELNQVYTNIIDNAIDALEGREDATLTIKTFSEGDFVKIAIVDNGPGIPEQELSKIFDPFFTTKDIGKGTGMGLDVVKKIVSRHNGDVKVKSKPGFTEFCLCFPQYQA